MATTRRNGVKKRELTDSKLNEPSSKRPIVLPELNGDENKLESGNEKAKKRSINDFFGGRPKIIPNVDSKEKSKCLDKLKEKQSCKKKVLVEKTSPPVVTASIFTGKKAKVPASTKSEEHKSQKIGESSLMRSKEKDNDVVEIVKTDKGKRKNKKNDRTDEKMKRIIEKTRPQLLLDHVDHAPFINVGTSTMEYELPVTDIECKDLKFLSEKTESHGKNEPCMYSQKWTDLISNCETVRCDLEDFEIEILPLESIQQKSNTSSSTTSQLQLWHDILNPTTTEYWSSDCSEHVNILKKSLKRWKKRLDKEAEEETLKGPKIETKKKKKSRRSVRCISESDEEDFSDDGDYMPDRDALEQMENPIIFYGPIGAGKENLVCSLARCSGFEVLEMHCGEKRDADTLKRKLQGATSTHRMTTNSVATFFGGAGAKKVEEARKHTLILVSSIDVVFEADRDFAITLSNFLGDARVPVILTCETKVLDGPLIELPRIAQYEVPLPNMVADILERAARELGQKRISSCNADRIGKFFENDVHKALQWLQLACQMEGKYHLPVDRRRRAMNLYSDPTVRSESEHSLSAVFVDHLQIQDELRLRNEELLSYIQPVLSPPRKASLLPCITDSLKYFGSVQALSTDIIPMLQIIDESQRKRLLQKRRTQHYFDRVENDSSIDKDGQLRQWLHLFNKEIKNEVVA